MRWEKGFAVGENLRLLLGKPEDDAISEVRGNKRFSDPCSREIVFRVCVCIAMRCDACDACVLASERRRRARDPRKVVTLTGVVHVLRLAFIQYLTKRFSVEALGITPQDACDKGSRWKEAARSLQGLFQSAVPPK